LKENKIKEDIIMKQKGSKWKQFKRFICCNNKMRKNGSRNMSVDMQLMAYKREELRLQKAESETQPGAKKDMWGKAKKLVYGFNKKNNIANSILEIGKELKANREIEKEKDENKSNKSFE